MIRADYSFILLTLYLIILLIFYWQYLTSLYIFRKSGYCVISRAEKQTINFLSRLCFLFGENVRLVNAKLDELDDLNDSDIPTKAIRER